MKKSYNLGILLLVFVVNFQSSNGLPVTTATSMPFPWAKLVQQKFPAAAFAAPSPLTMTMTTSTPASGNEPSVATEHSPTKINFPPELFEDFLKQLITHIKAKTGNQTEIEITTTTVVPSHSLETTEATTSTENKIEAEEKESIKDADAAIIKEVYLDWVKRQARESIGAGDDASESEVPAPQLQLPPVEVDSEILIPQAPANPQQPAEQLSPSNPLVQVPLSYSPAAAPSPFYPFGMYNPLAVFKMQKLMAQAQVDAALAALNITTTPKPTKIKLKFMLPVGGTLPPGLENYIVS